MTFSWLHPIASAWPIRLTKCFVRSEPFMVPGYGRGENFALPSSLPEVECPCPSENWCHSMMNYLLVALVALASGVALGMVLSRARESGLRLRLAALEAESSTRTGELRELRSQADVLNSDKQRAEQEVAVLNERLLQERRGAAEKLELLTAGFRRSCKTPFIGWPARRWRTIINRFCNWRRRVWNRFTSRLKAGWRRARRRSRDW